MERRSARPAAAGRADGALTAFWSQISLCEERSDETIQYAASRLDCLATLAMACYG